MGCDKVACPAGGLLRQILPIRFRNGAAWPTFSFRRSRSVPWVPEPIDHELLFPYVGRAGLSCRHFARFLPKKGQGAS